MWLKELGMTPCSSGLPRFPDWGPGSQGSIYTARRKKKSAPSIVYVFPVPVCPYANIVPMRGRKEGGRREGGTKQKVRCREGQRKEWEDGDYISSSLPL